MRIRASVGRDIIDRDMINADKWESVICMYILTKVQLYSQFQPPTDLDIGSVVVSPVPQAKSPKCRTTSNGSFSACVVYEYISWTR